MAVERSVWWTRSRNVSKFHSPPLLCISICLITNIFSCNAYIYHQDINEDFHNYEIINPVIIDQSHLSSRVKRNIHQSSNIYPQAITLQYHTYNKSFYIDLDLNVDLFPEKYYEKHHVGNASVLHHPNLENIEHCYYQGKVNAIEGSWAAISTCNNKISGVVDDGQDSYYIEPISINNTYTSHYIVKQSQLKENYFKCGYSGTDSLDSHSTLLRTKRQLKARPPHSSNRYSRYVELTLVSDKLEFEKFNKNKQVLFARSKQIGNIVNALYAPLNIYIALVGVVVWSNHDEIKLDTDGDTTLTKFLEYRRERLVKEIPNDNAQLITGLVFDNDVVGKALKGTICTHEYSGGVNMDHSKVVGLVATTVAHELGHNFGLEHDKDSCKCPANRCIMASSSSSTRPSHWSSCSLEYFHHAFEQGMDYCLHNKPKSLIGPVCGNGFLEDGEECDCGLKEHCDNYCCNPDTCRLHSNASCATGMCCDIPTCQVKPVSVSCREAISECDLPEYCNGESEFCPDDVFIQDGTSCKKNKAHCNKGKCTTHMDQCKLLWGPTGQTSDPRCFNQNMRGKENGNCGYNMINKSFTKCKKEDVMCGMLHCIHLNEKLEFGLESASKSAKSYIRIGSGKILTCRSALVDLGTGVIDPGLAPDGAICGTDKMCYDNKCVDVKSIMKSCPYDCNNNGVCNSNNNCHCVLGFGPPYCDSPGPGGSIDSGPASDPNAMYRFMVVMLVLFLGVVPIFIIIAFVTYVFRRDIKGWWMGKARRAAIKNRPKQQVNTNQRPKSTSKFNGTNRGSIRKIDISSPRPLNGAAGHPPNSRPLSTSTKINIRNLEISDPILQSQTTVNKPVRPAPPRPNTNAISSEGGSAKPTYSKANRPPSINRSESSISRGSVAARPSAPPPNPPSYWEATSNTYENTNRTAPKSCDNTSSVAALAKKFEISNSKNKHIKNGGVLNPKC